jgi:predicted PurR-regulated permease PerM
MAGVSPNTPEFARVHLWQIQAVRDSAWIAALIVLVWIGYVMRSVTVPLLVALMLAYLFEPLINWISNRYGLKRPVVVSALVLSIVVVLVLCVAIAVPLIVGQTMQMVRDLRSHRLEYTLISLRQHVPAESEWLTTYDSVAETLTDLIGARYRPPKPRELPAATGPAATQSEGEPQPEPVIATSEPEPAATQAIEAEPRLIDHSDLELREMIRLEVERQLAEHAAGAVVPDVHASGAPISATGAALSGPPVSSLWQLSRSTAGAIFGFIGQVLQIGFLFFLIPFYLFFFSLWYPRIVEFGRDLIPGGTNSRTLELLQKMDRVIAAFVRGRIVISLIIGIICAIGWTICGVPYAILLGLITGIFSAVPYLGFVGLPVAVLMLWVDQLGTPAGMRMSWFWIIAGPTLVYVVMQILETYLITPAIAGKATNLDPVTILVAVLAGGSVGGVYGMLLAIPAAACLKILLTDVVMPRVRMWVRGRAEDPLPL